MRLLSIVLILMCCFQGIVPTLIIVQIGLGMNTHDADTSASVVRTDGEGNGEHHRVSVRYPAVRISSATVTYLSPTGDILDASSAAERIGHMHHIRTEGQM